MRLFLWTLGLGVTSRRNDVLLLLGRGSVFLEQLLGGVELGGLLEAINGGIALSVELLEVGIGALDAKLEVACEGVADGVYTARG